MDIFLKFAVLTTLLGSSVLLADVESVTKKGTAVVKELKNDTQRAAKQVGRKFKEEKCKLENKNTECLGMKAKHAVQEAADNLEDAID